VRAFGFLTEGPGTGLYSGSADGNVRVWDVVNGGTACTSAVPVGGDVGSLLLAGGWLFIGLPNRVSCWHMGGSFEKHELSGHTGAVQALAAALERGVVFSGGQDRTLRAWRFDAAAGRFVAAGQLVGHTGGVTCLLAAGNLLFSGSLDGTVRVWDLDAGACGFVAPAHAQGVMSLLLWEGHLVSAGLDGRVRVWAGVGGPLENIYSHPPEEGAGSPAAHAGGARGRGGAAQLPHVIAMCGTLNAQGEPVLVVSFDDFSLRFFALPSFEDRGRLAQKNNVRALIASPTGFLSGDDRGLIRAWSWKAAAAASPFGG